jgi:hypothetical protein
MLIALAVLFMNVCAIPAIASQGVTNQLDKRGCVSSKGCFGEDTVEMRHFGTLQEHWDLKRLSMSERADGIIYFVQQGDTVELWSSLYGSEVLSRLDSPETGYLEQLLHE